MQILRFINLLMQNIPYQKATFIDHGLHKVLMTNPAVTFQILENTVIHLTCYF